jgi:hypothetical protein
MIPLGSSSGSIGSLEGTPITVWKHSYHKRYTARDLCDHVAFLARNLKKRIDHGCWEKLTWEANGKTIDIGGAWLMQAITRN